MSTSDRIAAPAASAAADRPASVYRRLPPWAIGWLAALVTFAVLAVRNRYLFSTGISEDSDFAANSILVDRAVRLHLLLGNYSRVGFHHPGPALLYAEAVGKVVAYRLLHAPAPFNGELLGVLALNSAVIGLVVRTVVRFAPGALSGLLVLATIFGYAALGFGLASAWFPDMYVAPFLLLAVAGAAVAAGRTGALPTYALAAGLLVHGHVSFLLFVGVATAAVAAAWIVSVGRGWRRELTGARRTLVLTGVVLAVFALPMVLELALHWPGPWSRYLHYSLRQGRHQHSLGSAVAYAGTYWPGGVTGALCWAAVPISIGCAVAERDAGRRRFVASLLGAVAVLSAVFVYYAARGVDRLGDHYIGRFSAALPLVLLLAAMVGVTGRWGQESVQMRSGDRRRAPGRMVRGGLAVLAVVGVVIAAAVGPRLTGSYRGDPRLPAMAQAAAASTARNGRTVGLTFPHDSWQVATGFLLAVHRIGVPVCVRDAYWTFLVTRQYVCARRPAALWPVTIGPLPAGSGPPAGAVLWRGGGLGIWSTER